MATEQKPRTSEINGKLWGARATDWAEIQEGTCRKVYLAVFERADVNGGTVYLDAGCGAGMAAQIAAEKGALVFGVDAAPALLEIARQRVPAGEFHIGELESLPFSENKFDLVTGFNSFQYAGNPEIALGEARRVTKPGAHVVIMTWGTPEGMEAASLIAALRPLLPPPPPGAPGPFAFRKRRRCAPSQRVRGLNLLRFSMFTHLGNTPIHPLRCAGSNPQETPLGRSRF